MGNPILEPLIERVLKPFKEWVKSLSWWAAAALLALLLTAWLAYKNPDTVEEWTDAGLRAGRVVIFWGQAAPLPERERKAAREKAAQLTRALDSRLDKKKDFDKQAWTTAQVLIALKESDAEYPRSIDPEPMEKFFRSQAGPGCPCWRKYPRDKYASNYAVTSWVLWALASYGVPPRKDEVGFVLAGQDEQGWWPMFAGATQEKFASTYATAVAVLALDERMRAERDGAAKARLRNAVDRGTTWLQGRVGGKARWADYPAWPDVKVQREMLGLSAFVLFVLHRAQAIGLEELDREWLRNLPADVPPANGFDASNRTVQTGGDETYTDDTRYYGLPWAIVATVLAYPSGSVRERLRATEWLEKALRPGASLYAISGTNEDDWIAAELLLAMRNYTELRNP